MSELNNTELQTTETIEEISSAAVQPAASAQPRGYQNRTARTLNLVHFCLLTATILFGVFQLGFVVMSGMQQGLVMTLLYSLPSILMLLIALFAVSYLFKFFAEVVELMDRKK